MSRCENCGTKLNRPEPFCSPDCRDQWLRDTLGLDVPQTPSFGTRLQIGFGLLHMADEELEMVAIAEKF